MFLKLQFKRIQLIYKLDRGYKGIIIEAATIFRAVLLGIKVIYNGHQLYRDLKLTNIGLIGKPLRSVLLDIGISRHIQIGRLLRPKLDIVSTISYLAPKLKLEDYNYSINIQSIGIILFKLIYNYYLQKFFINLQRNSKDNKKLRPFFQKSYQNAIDKIARDYKSTYASPARGYIYYKYSILQSFNGFQ